MMEVCYLTEIDRLLNVAASIKLRHKGLSLENCLQAKPLGAPKGPFFVSGGCCTSTYKCGWFWILSFILFNSLFSRIWNRILKGSTIKSWKTQFILCCLYPGSPHRNPDQEHRHKAQDNLFQGGCTVVWLAARTEIRILAGGGKSGRPGFVGTRELGENWEQTWKR